jgi:RecA/RadA recombinase
LAVSLAVIGAALRVGGLAVAANLAQVVSVVLVVPSLAAGLLVWGRRSARLAEMPGTAEMLRSMDVLAGLIEQQWKIEAALRSLGDPDPMPVQWRLTQHRGVMDHPSNITTRTQALAGASTHIAALSEHFRALRRRRLVILGEPGSGKTTLAVQLLLDLLATRQAHEPVPVLMSVAGWDTENFPRLHDWLAERLEQDYPAMRATEYGTHVPRVLATRGHILPVLDGLDELPGTARVAVITALNRSLGDGDQLILTSRLDEFADAVRAAGDVLTSAAVIEPLPLSAEAAAEYLRMCLPPEPSSAWKQVLTSLKTEGKAGSAAVLAEAVSIPLGLWLLRTTYLVPDADPASLVVSDRFPTPAALRSHLFGRLTAAVITTRPPSNDSSDHFRPRRRYDPERVQTWLGYLACHLELISATEGFAGTRDLVWWHLSRYTVPRGSFRRVAGIASGLTFGLMMALWITFTSDPISGLVMGVGVGLGSGLMFSLAASSMPTEHAGFADLHLNGRTLALIRHIVQGTLRVGLGTGVGVALGARITPQYALDIINWIGGQTWYDFISALMIGLTVGLMFGIGVPLLQSRNDELPTAQVSISTSLVLRLVARYILQVVLGVGIGAGLGMGILPGTHFAVGLGCAVGLASGLTFGFVDWAETPARTSRASTPVTTWRADRSLNLLRISVAVLAFGIAIGLLCALEDGLYSGIIFGITVGIAAGLGAGFVVGDHHAWVAYLVATCGLAWDRRLPRRLMPFLDDAHRLGLLRTVGAIYQFRHAEFQDHLAVAYRSRELDGSPE